MKWIPLVKLDFPGSPHQFRRLTYTAKALVWAAATAGQKVHEWRTGAARADKAALINILKSAVDLSGPTLVATPEFLRAGRTNKGHKSYYVGNTLCAHAAYSELKVPWLLDVENLPPRYRLTRPSPTDQRPDYLARDARKHWYVFESKGRSSIPSKGKLKDWKAQARSISRVNDCEVTQNIASAAFVNRSQQWELLWVDPPADSGDVSLELEDSAFFDAYYSPVIKIIAGEGPQVATADGMMRYISELGAYVGLHREVREAFEHRNTSAIVEFASRRMEAGPVWPGSETDTGVFADGVMIRLGPEYDDVQSEAAPGLPSGIWTKR